MEGHVDHHVLAYVLNLIRADASACERRAVASRKGAASRRRTAEMAHAAWKAEAHKVWLGDIDLSASAVARRVRDAIAAGAKAGSKVPSSRRIHDVIAPVRAVAKSTLVRSYMRTDARR